MHALHKILVYIPNVTLGDDLDREDLIEAIRDQAVSDTECYEGIVFDSRDTDDAGRWDDDYPCNVLFSKDNLFVFLKELRECYESQKNICENALKEINEIIGCHFPELSDRLFGTQSNSSDNYNLAFKLGILGSFPSGNYTINSCFYDTNAYTAKITESTIDMVKKDPNNWALVMCDYHY